MDIFKKLFGTDAKKIKSDCIMLPVPSGDMTAFPDLPNRPKNSGRLFSVINAGNFSIIRAKFNLLAGDCVLYLKDSPCENIFLFGSCGGLADCPPPSAKDCRSQINPRMADCPPPSAKDSERCPARRGCRIGDKIIAGESLNMESFSGMLDGRGKFASVFPDSELTGRLASFGREAGIRLLKCATVNSLFLEESYRDFFKNQGVKCLDMEASMVFSASRHTGLKAAALFYVSDIVGEKPFYEKRTEAESSAVSASKKELARVLREFIKNERTGN